LRLLIFADLNQIAAVMSLSPRVTRTQLECFVGCDLVRDAFC
jgi:hypothetical protein